MTTDPDNRNFYLVQPLPRLFARTATPILVVLSLNGVLTLADAYFVGRYVGSTALTAVTLMFPIFMMLVALSTLVGNGMASILARRLGASQLAEATRVFAGAHGLALAVSILLALGFAICGRWLALRAANGDPATAAMGYSYIAILIFASPVGFVLGIQSDALRSEGRIRLITSVGLAVTLLNIQFNYLLIAIAGLGVAGAAIGTVLAQILGLAFVVGYRLRGGAVIGQPLPAIADWRAILALGAPQSLTYLGVALGSAAIIAAMQIWAGPEYPHTVAAYGVISRILIFLYMPVLSIALAMQAIAGNNIGARLTDRSLASLRMAALTAGGYCLFAQAGLYLMRERIGYGFVDEPQTVGEVSRLLPMILAMYWAAGPLAMLSSYFQAAGDSLRAATLSLPRTYLFAIPLTFLLPNLLGESGIWLAGPTAETMMLLLAVATLLYLNRGRGYRWGIVRP